MTSQIRVDSIVPTTGVPTGGGGGIVQVVQGTTQTEVVVSTQNTYTDTTLEATITPLSASNKIFVIVNQFLYSDNGGSGFSHGGAIRVVRNPGNNVVYIPKTNAAGPIESYMSVQASGSSNSMAFFETKTITFLDSPTTTNPITYKTQGSTYTSSGTMTFNYGGVGSGADVSDSTSYITLMEVSA